MRLSVQLTTNLIPKAYRMSIVSLVKECIKRENTDYYQALYGFKEQMLKTVSFAVYLRNFKMSEHKIFLDGMDVTFSCPDYEFMVYLYNGLQSLTTFRYKEFNYQVGKIRMLPETKITESKVMLKTLSPILLENKDGKPISPYKEEYLESFHFMANQIVQLVANRPLKQEISFRPLNMKKVVVQESNHEFEKKFGQNQYLFFTAYQGSFELRGHPDDLNILYQTGVGNRRSQGFGLIDLY